MEGGGGREGGGARREEGGTGINQIPSRNKQTNKQTNKQSNEQSKSKQTDKSKWNPLHQIQKKMGLCISGASQQALI